MTKDGWKKGTADEFLEDIGAAPKEHRAKDSAPTCSTCNYKLHWRNKKWRCMTRECPDYGVAQDED